MASSSFRLMTVTVTGGILPFAEGASGTKVPKGSFSARFDLNCIAKH